MESSPAIGSDWTIYVGGEWGRLSLGLLAINPDGTEKWLYSTDFDVTSPAIGSDGTICVGSFLLTSYRPYGGLLKPSHNCPYTVIPASAGIQVLFGCRIKIMRRLIILTWHIFCSFLYLINDVQVRNAYEIIEPFRQTPEFHDSPHKRDMDGISARL